MFILLIYNLLSKKILNALRFKKKFNDNIIVILLVKFRNGQIWI